MDNAFIAEVERRMSQVLAVDTGTHGAVLADAARHLCLGTGGRRFRPLLVRLIGDALGAPRKDLLEIAVVAELIHASSLLHDDVVDGGELRRGKPTANAAYGNLVAVLAGDWLLSTGCRMLRPFPRELTVEAIETIAEMSRAAIAEVEARGSVELTPEAWRAIAEGKTGVLFAWCGRAAAMVAGRPEYDERLRTFGLELGVAFQLADDLRDVRPQPTGKDRFADLRNGNPSYPLIVALQASPELRENARFFWRSRPLESAQVEALAQEVLATDAEKKTATALTEAIGRAIAALGPLGETEWARDFLAQAVGYAAL